MIVDRCLSNDRYAKSQSFNFEEAALKNCRGKSTKTQKFPQIWGDLQNFEGNPKIMRLESHCSSWWPAKEIKGYGLLGQVFSWALRYDQLLPFIGLIFIVSIIGGYTTLDSIHHDPFLCFEGFFDGSVSVRFPPNKCISRFFGQHQNDSLGVWSTCLFVTGVQRQFSWIQSFLPSLGTISFTGWDGVADSMLNLPPLLGLVIVSNSRRAIGVAKM